MHDISQMSVTDFQPGASLREQLGIRNPILMYVGNLETYQGIDLLLEAFAKSLQQGVQLDLVIAGGSAEHIRHYGRKAEHLGASVHTHFIGPWPAARLGELLGEADILTAPRIRGINTPMKIFPYLHSGKAVLVTDLPTHSQILDDTVAELAPADSEGFAEAIVRLTQDPQRRERLGRAGRAFVEQNHTYAAHKSRVDELYDYVHRQIHCIALGVEQAAMNPSASKIA